MNLIKLFKLSSRLMCIAFIALATAFASVSASAVVLHVDGVNGTDNPGGTTPGQTVTTRCSSPTPTTWTTTAA